MARSGTDCPLCGLPGIPGTRTRTYREGDHFVTIQMKVYKCRKSCAGLDKDYSWVAIGDLSAGTRKAQEAWVEKYGESMPSRFKKR
jgi:hypothetical protein